MIVEIKIEIKKGFKLGFLDKIIKQIAFFDFYHICEIWEARVAHETQVAHYIDFISFSKNTLKVYNILKLKLKIHAVFVLF